MSDAREPSASSDIDSTRQAGGEANQTSPSDAREPSASSDIGGGEAAPRDSAEAEHGGVASLEQEGEIAADYVEGLLDVIDYDGDIDMDVEGERALVSVVGTSGRELVGPNGEVLEALQELTRLAVHQKTGVRCRLMLDIGGYRARRRDELTKLGRDIADQVVRTGQEHSLEPMTPFERKVVHDAVAAAGLRSESEGEEPQRYVVVLPAS